VDARARSELGRAAEDAAARHLEERGYTVVLRNVRVGHLEVDIVARKGPVVAIVEVRFRGPGAWTSALGSVDPAKRRRIRQAGDRIWRRYFKRDPGVERMRFDVIAVGASGSDYEIEHVPAAF
jgi:putative endonuclease